MNKDFYNELQLLYISLTERFSRYSDYNYDGFYKCYNNQYFFLRDEKKNFLEKLSNITINDIYSEEYKKATCFSEEYLGSELVKFGENKVCIIDGLGQTILYYILSLLKDELDYFIKYMEETKTTPNDFITYDEHHIYFAYTEFFERWVNRFSENQPMEMLIHLFTKTNSYIITVNFNGKIEINEHKIKEISSAISISLNYHNRY